MNNAEFTDLVEGKRVAIVGPAGYLEGLNRGKEIDDYDLVVRVNRGRLLSDIAPLDYGSKNDVLYLSTKMAEGENFQPLGSGFGIYINPCEKSDLVDSLDGGFCCHEDTVRWKHEFDDKTLEITTGMLALVHLAKMNPKELHITGFTFYLSMDGEENPYNGVYDGGEGARNPIHAAGLEVKIFKEKVIDSSANVTFDKHLELLIEKNGLDRKSSKVIISRSKEVTL